ncbi:hypothetical protein SAMN05518800_0053 [Variovorax sp. YR752]|uniref:DUF2169 family type VI secretion system accessory protein n=1 Tax=unclassified Variovorax TaxID=663243 RepID=UPI000BDB9B9B|nr:DUF2169 domain-containing protein [Variovorax sp. YR752]SOD21492.1 hypothetical protein SAMN05518800_0053 [Variovorax sp. YR752]
MSIALINETPYPAFGFDTELYDAREYHSLAVKLSFDLTEHGLQLREEQLPLQMTDGYVGEPGSSSLLAPSDLVPYRERTDVIITGEAVAPHGEPASRWLAEFRVGQLHKALQITGLRHWQHRAISGWELTRVEPVRSVPLHYEYAFGGEQPIEDHEQRDVWWPNPVGRGFVGRRKWSKDQVHPAPQLLALKESLSGAPGRTYRTASFGPVPGDWAPRVGRIGTTDENWRKNVAPHLPKDFDLRYFNCAPDDQQAESYLRGNEEVTLTGLFEDVRRFKLPNYAVTALTANHNGVVLPLEMDLSTVHIDLDASTVALTWHLTTPAADLNQVSLSVMER